MLFEKIIVKEIICFSKKSQICPFGANLIHFGPKSDNPTRDQQTLSRRDPGPGMSDPSPNGTNGHLGCLNTTSQRKLILRNPTILPFGTNMAKYESDCDTPARGPAYCYSFRLDYNGLYSRSPRWTITIYSRHQ